MVVFRDVAVTDTVREVTTVTIDRTEAGDTVFRSVVTDRERLRDRVAVSDVREKVVVVRDTVFIEKRDSVYVQTNTGLTNDTKKKSGFLTYVKWIFALVCAVVVLILVIRF